MAVRRLLHAAGMRYRVDRPLLPGLRRRADIVFGPSRVAVFIDGCFWHSCPIHGTRPGANAAWWQDKLQANRERDADTDRRLAAAGWAVLRAWEHEDPREVADRVLALVGSRRPPATPARAAAGPRPAPATSGGPPPAQGQRRRPAVGPDRAAGGEG